jgi:hypothetical protein
MEQFDKYFTKMKVSSIEELEKNYKLTSQVHGGICVSYNLTTNIVHFLENKTYTITTTV